MSITMSSHGYVPMPKQIKLLAALGYGADQIAKALDCNAGTVKSKASRHSIALGTRGRPRLANPIRAYRPYWKYSGDKTRIDPFRIGVVESDINGTG
jgi:hypothetical protein